MKILYTLNCIVIFLLLQEKHFNNTVVWDQTLFESAKCSIIFETIDKEKSIDYVIQESVLHQFKNLPTDYNQ